MPKLSAEKLRAVVVRILRAAGAPEHIAAVVARYVVDADLCGYPSHGVNTIPTYVEEVSNGRLVPDAEPEILQTGAGFLRAEGRKAFGHYAVDWLMTKLLARLDAQAVCLATVRDIGHVGRLGGYVEALSERGCMTMMTAGFALDTYESVVTPVGAAARRLGTNPIAVGAPTAGAPFVFDTSTAAATVFGVIKAARDRRSLPTNVLIDAQGSVTNNPEDFFAGGSILPFGGHKGFGLSLATCLLGALSGDCAPQADKFGGVALLAIKIDALMPEADYRRGADDFLSNIRSTPPLRSSAVRIPGDRAHATREKHHSEGVDVSEETWGLLMKCMNELGVSGGVESDPT
ncbi:MAG: Ldh family oxidoreductase [Pyrinomonadaceae bacterium]